MLTKIELIKNQFLKLWEKGAFHIFIGSFLSKFVAFFASIFLVRVLSKKSYGVLGYIENIYGYAYIFAGLGLAYSVLRYIVLADHKEEKFTYYKYALNKSSLLNFILIFIVGSISFLYPHPVEFKSAKWLLIIMLLALPFQYMIDINNFTYRAMFSNKRYAITTFITTTVLIASRYLGAVLYELNGVIASKVIINLLFGILLTILTYKLYFSKVTINEISLFKKKEINKYSFQYMVTNGVWAIFMLNDVFLLGRLGGDATLIADYKVAYVLPGNLSIFVAAIGIFVAPYFVRHESDYKWVKKNYFKVLGISSSIIAFLVVLLIIFAEPVITLLYGSQYVNVVPIMRLLLIAAFANCGLRFTTANLLAAMGQIKYNMIVSFTGVILQIIINIILIPYYGVIGVAYTSIFVYFMMALILFIVFAKKYSLFSKISS
ncbi:oligosaccharide flippase family protein [Alkalibaculum sp. M08DMB]|uniref:Oligosaccharide flippase family protein n=1 Tax=Alkalibaculum sporogenes TaxID=2655001 RepID=A0A6A7KCT5_9FIRM|nr:oligosaccharide flippase family protein [Alkalibaculum sporogenes]MPW26977.1 oligosaccharide flippase family protein [Alkalibaculum sporogenes]